jgi:hypothetical protein
MFIVQYNLAITFLHLVLDFYKAKVKRLEVRPSPIITASKSEAIS